MFVKRAKLREKHDIGSGCWQNCNIFHCSKGLYGIRLLIQGYRTCQSPTTKQEDYETMFLVLALYKSSPGIQEGVTKKRNVTTCCSCLQYNNRRFWNEISDMLSMLNYKLERWNLVLSSCTVELYNLYTMVLVGNIVLTV